MNLNLFNETNTEGYTQGELDALNAEWESIVDEQKLAEGSDIYEIAAKAFCNAVAQR